VALALVARWVWARRRLAGLNPTAARLYHEDWLRQRGRKAARYLFHTGPVFVVVVAVAWLGVTTRVGFLPWIVAGGVCVVVWWFAWRPAWRRLSTLLEARR
jgi:hypothetical protein